MEELRPEEDLTMQLRELRHLLGALQTGGEDMAISRSLHIHTWIEKYLEGLLLNDSDKNFIINDLFRFYDSETMSFEDWQDKIALIPLQLLVSHGYPSWDDVTPAHIEKCLDIAADKGSERHGKECFMTGDDEGCFVSKKCTAKVISQMGLDLATGLTALEVVSIHAHDAVTKKRALEGIRTIGSMFARADVITSEDYEEFLDAQHHGMSLSLRPDMYEMRG